jgi:hypothetical protein
VTTERYRGDVTNPFKTGIAIVSIFALAANASARESTEEGIAVRRFALLVGANYGGLDRVRLRYAESDTRSIARVLVKLGGVDPKDRLLVTEPRPRDLKKAFKRMGKMLAAANGQGHRVELIFYYSGHSDESGLLLGGKHFGYQQICKAIKALPANVRVAILDSCSSGAFTRTKGGKRRAPFLFDTSTNVRGDAVLTSSSASEAAQESDRLGGSFFTHYLVSGLRGAADINCDKRVTLAEAYQYAFNETLARTESTQTGPQHPNYDFQLAGSGDLTLTDLRSSTTAVLELGPEVSGRLFIRDKDGHLVAEVNKPANQPMIIGLEPGSYRVTLETPAEYRRGTVEIGSGKHTRLNVAELDVIEAERTTARGGPEGSKEVKYRDRFFSFSVFPGLDNNSGSGPPVRNNLSINMLAGMGGALSGLEISGIGAIRTGPVKGLQIGGIFNAAESFRGLEVGGITNIYNGGLSRGATISGVVDISAGQITGLQLGGCLAVARSIYGAQVSVISLTWDDFHGAQIGVVALSDDVVGGQVGVTSISTGEVRGIQWGVANVTAGNLKGLQMGVTNVIAGEFTGAQIGVVNWATKSKGIQLGIINVAAEGADSIPIGLVNIIADGIFRPTVWMSDTSLTNVSLKMGSRKFHSIIGGGFQTFGDNNGVSFLAGFGGHIELNDPMWLDLDLVSQSLYRDFDFKEGGIDFLNKFRATLGWQIAEHFSVYGGLSLNFLVSEKRKHAGPAFLRLWAHEGEDVNQDLGLGLILGIQI